jgi:hypothetical protein
MSLNDVVNIRADLDELTRRFNEQSGQSSDTTALGAVTQNQLEPQPVPATPAIPPQDQQLRNTDFSYTVNGYKDTVAAPGTDKVREAAFWFSNDSVVAGQTLSLTDAETSSTNKTLKTPDHSTYDAAYCDYDISIGCARMTGVKSLDAPFPTSPIYPGRTEYSGARVALRNSQIRVPTDCHLGAFLYDNNGKDVIKAGAAFHITAAVRGTPAATTDRKYKVLAKTDKGFSYLSDEADVAAAPSDADFASGTADVDLEWDAIPGILEYWVYRHDITAAKYRLLIVISNGANTYADNNYQLNSDTGGYPSSTDTTLKSYVATSDGELTKLPVNGVDASWADLFLNVPVPTSVAALGAGFQWYRLQLDKAMDREFAGVTTINGNTTISTGVDQFVSLDAGRTVNLTSADGLHTLTTTVASYTDTKHVVLTAAPTWGDSNTDIYITGGGDHGLLIDLIHVGYVAQAKWGAYPDDLTRALPPAATPSSSGQGGTGSGGGSGSGDPGGGGIGCITADMPVTRWYGHALVGEPFRLTKIRTVLFSGNLKPNWIVLKHRAYTDDLHAVKVRANWFFDIYLECSPGHPLISGHLDGHGHQVIALKPGDYVLAHVNGHVQRHRIFSIRRLGRESDVFTYSLRPAHIYAAGMPIFRSRWRKFLHWLLRMDTPVVGLMSKNVKNDGPEIF